MVSSHDSVFCTPIRDVGELQFLHILLNTGCSSGCPTTHHVAYTGLVLFSFGYRGSSECEVVSCTFF